MTEIVGIRFRNAGKIYYFSTAGFQLEPPMHVIVETARGIEMGTVLLGNREVEDDKVVQPLKPVIRIATEEDDVIVEENRRKEKEAFKICKEKIEKHGLDMKLVDAEYTFDNNKLLFYFTADGRIDFRELVKDLAAIFRTRIELRQIGVRDEAKIMGGMGICGRELCCKTFLFDFAPVSIKMAKEQNLSLNPAKISGVCGRLMCCLKNEQETYEYLNSKLPVVGDSVTTFDGFKGEVTGMSVLRQTVKVLVENGDVKELREYKVDEISFKPSRKKAVKVTEEELAELKQLEDEGTEIVENSGKKNSKEKKNYQEKKQERKKENFADNKNSNDNDKKTEKKADKGEENKATFDKKRKNEGRLFNDSVKNEKVVLSQQENNKESKKEESVKVSQNNEIFEEEAKIFSEDNKKRHSRKKARGDHRSKNKNMRQDRKNSDSDNTNGGYHNPWDKNYQSREENDFAPNKTKHRYRKNPNHNGRKNDDSNENFSKNNKSSRRGKKDYHGKNKKNYRSNKRED
nr:stage 0 sporulation family protein [Lachnobacterium bovis]